MGKKKEDAPPPGSPAWMSTFSDMMTLLMCFFVLLFSMSNVDEAKFDAVSESFQQTFSIFQGGAQAIGDGILISNGVSQLNQLDEYINSTGKQADDNSDATDLEESEKGQTQDEGAGLENQNQSQSQAEQEISELQAAISELEAEKMKLSEELAEKLEEALEENNLQGQVDIDFTNQYVMLTLNGSFLFDSGQATLKEEAIPVLDKVGVLLEKYIQSGIEVEGHTDAVPLNGGRYENNNVLSSYRALAVFDYLLDHTTLQAAQIKHSGRGEYDPIADNTTPEGRAKNRRVEIKIYNSLSGY